MPNLKLTNLLSYKEYFAGIAAQHVAIEGYKWGDDVVIKNDNRSNTGRNMLWTVPYEQADYEDNFSDNVHKRKQARVSYLEVRNKELFASIDEQYNQCETIIEEIIARILRDKAGYQQGNDWVMIATEIKSFKTIPVEMTLGSTPYIGYELQMDFMDNSNFQFNTQRWKDTLV
jgi:hypothetical protein